MRKKTTATVAAVEPVVEEVTTSEEKPALSSEVLVGAVLNTPEVAIDEFKLGDKTYKILDLGYRDYTKFLFYMQPLMETFMGALTSARDVSIPGINLPLGSLNVQGLLKYCDDSLPEMVCIVCKQTDPDMTSEKVMDAARSPMQLARIVLQQIARNKMVEEFVDFFGEMTRLLGTNK